MTHRRCIVRAAAGAALSLCGAAVPGAPARRAEPGGDRGTVYLTLDTGNMSEADRIADILQRSAVRATFFVASERTPAGDRALDDGWAPYWRARVAEGHAFGNHTYDHVYLRERGAAPGAPDGTFLARPQFGASAGRTLRWDGAALCRELDRVQQRFRALTGRARDPLWRAPGGRAPAAALRASAQCGWRHVHWADAGFLGDELPADRYPNRMLLARALDTIRDGDVLMMHLGIWSRSDPFAPMLEPLIDGLKQRRYRFATVPEHPRYASAAGTGAGAR